MVLLQVRKNVDQISNHNDNSNIFEPIDDIDNNYNFNNDINDNNNDLNSQIIDIVSKAKTATVSDVKEGVIFPSNINGSDVRVGIIMARWNADIISGLYKGVNESLTACGVKQSNTFTTYVPGKTKIKNYLDIKYIHYILLFFYCNLY